MPKDRSGDGCGSGRSRGHLPDDDVERTRVEAGAVARCGRRHPPARRGTSRASPSQSTATDFTYWAWPEVSPLRQYSWRLRDQNVTRPSVRVRRTASTSIQPSMRTSALSCCWTIAATRPESSKRSRLETVGSRSGTDAIVPRGRRRREDGPMSDSPPTLARRERLDLCDTFEAVGPDAPTLCMPWTTRDLAAHLVVREGRPDLASGIWLPFLKERTEREQARIAAQPWPELVEAVRSGPPGWHPARLPARRQRRQPRRDGRPPRGRPARRRRPRSPPGGLGPPRGRRVVAAVADGSAALPPRPGRRSCSTPPGATRSR